MESGWSEQERIAMEIVEHNPAIALRVSGEAGEWKTHFITQNISLYGYTREEFIKGELSWQDIVHPDDLIRLRQIIDNYVKQGIDSFNIFYRIVDKTGKSIWIADSTTVSRDEKGNVVYCDCIISDYSKIKDTQNKIEDYLRQQKVMNDILQSFHNNNAEESFEIILDRTGQYLDISRVVLFADAPEHASCQAVYEWCNKNIPSLTRKRIFRLDYQQDFPEVIAGLSAANRFVANDGELTGAAGEVFKREGVCSTAVFAVDLPEGRYGFICFDECVKKRIWRPEVLSFLENVAKLVSTTLIQERNVQAVEHMAYYDPLTGLTNRYHFDACLQTSIDEARQSGDIGYVLFIDMDDFKIINDGYGHHYGDAMLVEIADFFTRNFRDKAEIFRFGGDEFLILVNNLQSGEIQGIIDEILERGQHPWKVLDKTFYCTVSMGVVRYPDSNAGVKELVRYADIALHQAKEHGKNNYSVYRHSFDNESILRAELEHRMRKCIENDFEGFEVYYQPLVTAKGAILGAEALLRWHDDSGEIMLPGEFIPLAEYLGLIIPLGSLFFKKRQKSVVK